MQKIRPCLWFNDNAEEAVYFYESVFRNSKTVSVMRTPADGPQQAGSVLAATFVIEGQEFIALNGGPHFTFTPAISLFVTCQAQDEVDELWEKLCAGGAAQRCGWVTDRFGVSWQIVPAVLGELMQDPDRAKAARVMQAMLKMEKLDIATLRHAYDGS